MKSIIVTTILTAASLFSFAQDKKELTDDLLKDKEKVLAKYIPMANGEYLNKAFQFPLDSLLIRVDAFKADYDKQISKEKVLNSERLRKRMLCFIVMPYCIGTRFITVQTQSQWKKCIV